MTARINPIEFLPDVFSRYLAWPKRMALIPIVLLVVILGLLAGGEPDSTAGTVTDTGNGSSTENVVSISAGDPCALELEVSGAAVRITSGPQGGSSIVRDESGNLVAYDSSGAIVGTLRTAAGDEGPVKEIFGANGALKFSTKGDEEGYKVLSPTRELVTRVKFKEDKFNVYSASGQRALYGKFKKGSILIRDDAGSDITWISGGNFSSLNDAAPLCLPIDPVSRSLLFASSKL